MQNITVKKLPSDGLTIKYSPNDQYIAVGCKSGSILLYNTQERIYLLIQNAQILDKISARFQCMSQTSVTCLKWRPNQQGKYNVLATSDAQGSINYWHVPSMKKIFSINEYQNSVLSLDFDPTGRYLASGGKDCTVRVYDQETKTISKKFGPAQWNHAGHDNRIFCVKFIQENILMSGGWDSVVHIWDLRQSKSIRHFYGAHISGDSLDYQNGKILTGCYSPKNQLQIWSFNKGTKMQDIDWTNNPDQAEYIYTAQFNKLRQGMFAAGSTGLHSQLRIYKENSKDRFQKVMGLLGVNQGIFSLNFANRSQQIVFTTANQGFYLYEYQKSTQQ